MSYDSLPAFTAASCLSCHSHGLSNCTSSIFHLDPSLKTYIQVSKSNSLSLWVSPLQYQECWMPPGVPVSLLYSLPAATLLTVLDRNTDSFLRMSKLFLPQYSTIPSILPPGDRRVKVEVMLPHMMMAQQMVVVRVQVSLSSAPPSHPPVSPASWWTYLAGQNYLVTSLQLRAGYQGHSQGDRLLQAEDALHSLR